MRLSHLLLVVVLCPACSGCGLFWKDTIRNLVEAPLYGIDDCRITERNRRLARQAWDEVSRAHHGEPVSSDYAEGFKDGFADYLESGGNGQPPAVPPYRYRLSRYQTPEGLRDIENWYAGFREGSAAARASGLREQFILPLSAPPINALVRNPDAPAGPVTPPLAPDAAPVTPQELPPPRPAGPEEAAPGPPG